jgi:alkaline phosphatase
MTRLARYAALLAALAIPTQGLAQHDPPPRIILFIGDGVGVSYWTAAAFAADDLAVYRFPVVGLVDTRASDSKVTDSAAGATAYATGVQTYNGAIGVAPDSSAVPTILEMATERGMATGLVATSRITHATPASFAAHVPSRGMEVEIARQMVQEHDITVIIGGGSDWFDRTRRPDGIDLLTQAGRGATVVQSPEEFAALDLAHVDRLFALLAESHLPAAVQPAPPPITHQGIEEHAGDADTTWTPWREPSLADMTTTALTVLDKDPDGFFLMVEASQPDWRGHGNEPLPTVEAEMLDFDRALGAALTYQDRQPETLVVVVADHETGGLALQLDPEGRVVARYTTDNHTGEMIPLFAAGPGAERFGGILTNHEIGRRLIAVLTGD